MQLNLKTRALGLLLGLCGLAISSGLFPSPARAEDADRPILPSAAPAQVPAPAQAEHAQLQADKPAWRGKAQAAGKRKTAERSSAGQYFVEFRSRYALSYGHTFLVHGRLGPKGEVKLTPETVAGLHPAGDGPQLWTLGHAVFVPSETGPSDGDLEEEYVSARYRVLLSEAEYRTVAAHIRQKQKSSPMWHAVFYNCNAWVGEIARFMGLKAPANSMLYPADYINNLKGINGGQQHAAVAASGQESYANNR